MNEVDEAILELMADIDAGDGVPISKNPKSVYLDLAVLRNQTDKASNTISRRMDRLDKMGLLDQLDTSGKYYVITDNGRRFVDGDLSASEIPNPDDVDQSEE